MMTNRLKTNRLYNTIANNTARQKTLKIVAGSEKKEICITKYDEQPKEFWHGQEQKQ